MKTEMIQARRPAFARTRRGRSLRETFLRGRQCIAVMVALLFAAGKLTAMPTVETLTGGPSWFYPQTAYGYVDGNTASEAKFRTPYGIALDTTADYLFVADRDNNAVRQLDLAGGWTYTFVPNEFVPASLISQPVGVALDTDGNVYVLNRGNGNNGTVLQFDSFGDLVKTNATGLIAAAGMAMDGAGNIYLTVQNNTLLRIAPDGTQTNVATITEAGASLQGIVFKRNGLIAACDAGRHGVYLIDPNSGIVTTNAGFHGVGDFSSANNVASAATARFNQPYGVAEAGDGTLVVADYGNHRIKAVLTSGVVSNLCGVSSSYWYGPANPSQGIFPGWWDGTVTVPDLVGGVEARQPVGVVFSPDGTVYTTETYYHLIRKVITDLPPPPPAPPGATTIFNVTTNYGEVTLAWSAVAGATDYIVKRAPSSGGPYTTLTSTTATSYTDTSVVNGATYYYVVSASNAGGEGPNSAEVIATVPMPPVPEPLIGYVEFPPPNFTSVFHPVSSAVFNNDKLIVIVGTEGTETFYEYANVLDVASVTNPTTTSASAPVGYVNGLYSVIGLTVAEILPTLTIKAVGHQDGRPDSAIASAQFQFKVGNPLVIGNNAAQFNVSDITDGAELWYTIDDTDPTNAAPSEFAGTVIGTNAIPVQLEFPPGVTNLTFKIRGFKANYQPSGIVSTSFSLTNYNANKITFGFAAGEASSEFIGSAGQNFYAPVTLTLLPGATMYSLQFNVTVTNAGPNPGPAVTPGVVGFESKLLKPIPGIPGLFERIPTYMFLDYATNLPPPEKIEWPDGMPFVDLRFVETNSGWNLIGVGWLERAAKTNLYDTTKQDLITYSMAHDTLFESKDGKVVVGGYNFRVPATAQPGDTYEIQIGRPTATSDGIGAPGKLVVVDTPTAGSMSNGPINATKWVTVGQRKYVVGDAYDFKWFNAGDFGNGYLDNADVMQVFQSVIYKLNYPLYDESSWNGIGYTNVSDFYDAMDSCGRWVAVEPDYGQVVLETNASVSSYTTNTLFYGSDPDINRIVFGDGMLDVTDVYVTFRRSLDPSLKWFHRFWTNGIRAAEITTNWFPGGGGGSPDMEGQIYTAASDLPAITFASSDVVASAGQTLQIPVKANVLGSFPLRVLMLNLTVQPLDGSPALTEAVQFAPAPELGQPTVNDSRGNGNYSAAWLNNQIAGFTSNAVLGILTVKIPDGCPDHAAYALHFDHASGSPNGIASFPKQTRTGLITLAERSASTFSDGIPDSWRLRYFGSIYNYLSQAGADADGDGASNLEESKADTDPNDAQSVFRLLSKTGQNFVIRWPTIANKRYVVERAPTLYGPAWTPVLTNTGTGFDIECHDPNPGAASSFYRVRLAE